MEQNGLVERRGRRKDPNDWSGDWINYESRDDPGPVVVKVKPKKKLALAGDTNSRTQSLLPQRWV